MRKLSVIAVIAVMLISLFAASVPAGAMGIETENTADLTISYLVDNNAAAPNVEFKVYKIADIDAYGNFTVTQQFEKYNVSLDVTTSSEWTDLAAMLSDYITRDDIEAAFTNKTDTKGQMVLKGLPLGMYLAVGNKYTSGRTTYTAEPFLVCLPNKDVNTSEWQYEVTSDVKYSSVTSSSSGGGGGGSSTTSLTVRKSWADSGHTGDRPSSVTVQLLRSGKVYSEMTLSASNDWTYRWTGLSRAYTWTVVEKTVPDGYRVGVSKTGTSATITNTWQSSPSSTAKPTASPSGSTTNPTAAPGATNAPGTTPNPAGGKQH